MPPNLNTTECPSDPTSPFRSQKTKNHARNATNNENGMNDTWLQIQKVRNHNVPLQNNSQKIQTGLQKLEHLCLSCLNPMRGPPHSHSPTWLRYKGDPHAIITHALPKAPSPCRRTTRPLLDNFELSKIGHALLTLGQNRSAHKASLQNPRDGCSDRRTAKARVTMDPQERQQHQVHVPEHTPLSSCMRSVWCATSKRRNEPTGWP